MDRRARLALLAKPTLTVRHDPLLGYYGYGLIAGRTAWSTGYFKTEAEAWEALRDLCHRRTGNRGS